MRCGGALMHRPPAPTRTTSISVNSGLFRELARLQLLSERTAEAVTEVLRLDPPAALRPEQSAGPLSNVDTGRDRIAKRAQKRRPPWCPLDGASRPHIAILNPPWFAELG